METIPKSWGSTLRARRKTLKLSQEQVAVLTGKAQSQIARLEAGKEDPRLSSIVQVARSLGTELIAVPVRLLPAVRHLLEQHTELKTPTSVSRFVGNDPEDIDEGSHD